MEYKSKEELQKLAAVVVARRQQAGLSLDELADRIFMERHELQAIEDAAWPTVGPLELRGVARALQMSPADLYAVLGEDWRWASRAA